MVAPLVATKEILDVSLFVKEEVPRWARVLDESEVHDVAHVFPVGVWGHCCVEANKVLMRREIDSLRRPILLIVVRA